MVVIYEIDMTNKLLKNYYIKYYNIFLNNFLKNMFNFILIVNNYVRIIGKNLETCIIVLKLNII